MLEANLHALAQGKFDEEQHGERDHQQHRLRTAVEVARKDDRRAEFAERAPRLSPRRQRARWRRAAA